MISRSTILTLSSALLILVFGLAQAGESRIYKTVDEHGNVVFTDIPPREEEPAEQIIIEDPNSFAPEEADGPREQWIVEAEGEDTELIFSYQSLVIAAPEDDQAIRENAGNVSIVAVPSPRMLPGHRMRLLMDGQPVREGTQTRFDLENVDRGTHVIATEILDGDGNVLIRSDDITFHLQRYRIPTPRPGA
jgi:hypothetical protein